MDLRQVLATNLRRIRHEKGISKEELAYEAEINRTYMSKVEKGDTWVGARNHGQTQQRPRRRTS
jgi:DNA-binding XRE family transcriptional regulator